MPLARKAIKQRISTALSPEVAAPAESFRLMCNDAIRIGLAADATSLKRLSKLTYGELERYKIPRCYKLCAISKAAGILSARKKSIKRGFPTGRPYLSKGVLVSCYGFKVEAGSLLIPLGERRFERIPLNSHTLNFLSQTAIRVRSFTITEDSLALCVAKNVEEMSVLGVVGVDRNLRNITAGNEDKVTYYDVSKVVEIAENTRSIIRAFKRNDVRTRKELAQKYGRRRQDRIRQILNRVSKYIVIEARKSGQAVAFESIEGMRKLYRRGNGQGRGLRGRMNSWPFGELKRQVEYKAAWEGVPVINLTMRETRGTTMDCPRCGERLPASVHGDVAHHRQLWCQKCERWDDRDLIAVMNISHRGWSRFDQSKGEAVEVVNGNPEGSRQQVILRVDASKPSLSPHPTKT